MGKWKMRELAKSMRIGAAVGFALSGMALSTTASAALDSTRLDFAFKSKPTLKQMRHIDGTSLIIIDFDDSTGLSSPATPAKDDPIIGSVSTQENGKKLRLAINVKEPVMFQMAKDGSNFELRLTQSKDYAEGYPEVVNASLVSHGAVKAAADSSVKPNPSSETKVAVLQQSGASKPMEQAIRQPTESQPAIATTKPLVAPQSEVVPEKERLTHVSMNAGEGVTKLVLDMSGKMTAPQISEKGNLLIIDLPNADIPKELQKNVSTSSLGTVVQDMDIAMQGDSGRIVLSQNDGWKYSEYQMDKKIVVEIRPTATAPVGKYVGKLLTLNFQNMSIRAILQVIADFTGLNIMTSDSVTGTMTIRLKDVPWDQALALVLEAKNLQEQRQGNVIWIATRSEILQKNKSQLELNGQEDALAPLELRFFQLNYYKASDMKNVLMGKSGSGSSGGASASTGGSASGSSAGGAGSQNAAKLLSKRGSVGVDIRNNKIFVQDTEAKLDEISKIIKKLDIPTKQVLIQAKLVVVTDSFGHQLGAQVGFALGRQNGNTHLGLSNSAASATGIANGVAPTDSAFNLPVSGGGQFGFTILNAATGNMINLALSALDQTNNGRVISSPRLITANNQKAEIKQGTEIPYVTPGYLGAPPTVSFKDAVLSLDVTPQISPNGRVTMALDISKDTVGQLVNVQGGGQVPSIDTRKIKTQVTIKDGQTVVLGGIYEVTKSDNLSQVPILGNIPWIGNLFKSTDNSNQKVELLIFITPHVITDSDLDAIGNNETVSGNEIGLSEDKKPASKK